MTTFRFNLLGGTVVALYLASFSWAVKADGQQPVTIVGGTMTVSSVTQNPDVRQATAANLNAQVVGNVAEDLAVAGNPVQVAGRASTSVPAAVSTNDVVRPWMSLNGSLNAILRDSVGDSVMDDTNNAVRMTVVSGGAVDLADGAATGPGPLMKVLGRTAVPTDTADGTVITAWATRSGSLHTVPTAAAAPDGAAANCALISTASTNATNCKASAGVLYDLSAVNTTATVVYLRLYNLAAAPTCSSATGFIETIPVPASTTGAGIVRTFPVGRAYTTGVGACVTGGGSSTDNTNAVAGVYVSLGYK
jgi:hypothetical protein